MATDVRVDQGDGSFLELEGRVVKAISSDFMLDSPQRRQGGGPFRRALVHDGNDGLTINFARDYPGGVTIAGPVSLAEVIPQRPAGLLPEFVPTLVVRGGISYEVQGMTIEGNNVRITVVVEEEINKLQSQILELQTRVAALET
jgi:hypothetical protein